MDLGSENVFCMLTIVLVSYHYIANDKPCKIHAEHAIPSLTMLWLFFVLNQNRPKQEPVHARIFMLASDDGSA